MQISRGNLQDKSSKYKGPEAESIQGKAKRAGLAKGRKK